MIEHDDVQHAREMLRAVLGEHAGMIDTEGTRDTPQRLMKALVEMTGGYELDPLKIMSTTFPSEAGEHSGVVVVRDIPFVSVCEHHVLPFTGTVSVGYLPSDRIVGLSKIPRMVRALSRRLQVQERLTQQIGEAFAPLKPRAVAVQVKGRHSCCSLRGIESPSEMVTSRYFGLWDEATVADASEYRGRSTSDALLERQLVAMQRAEIARLLNG